MTSTDRLEKIIKAFQDSPSLQKTNAGIAFNKALQYRESALAQARKVSNDSGKTLAGSNSLPIRSAYQDDLDQLLIDYPDFTLLHRTLFEEYEG